MPRVSVILPAYNAQRFIEAAVRSILDGSFTDLELIAIDDGSKDGTLAILQKIAKQDNRLRIITRPNRGLVPTLNEGIEAARAELVARMDADDISLPRRIAQQVAYMDAHPDVVLLGGGYWLIDELGRRLTVITPPSDDATLQENALLGKTPVCHPLAMFRKSAVVQAGGYVEKTMLAEDLDLWLRLGEIGKIACLSETLLEYRQHAGSVSESRQLEQQQRLADVVKRAYERRGLQRALPTIETWRATGDSDARHRQLLKYGWWAWNSGHRATARSYGWAAVRASPLASKSWKLLLCTVLKKSPTPTHS